jgi:hypothetical protein
MHQERIHRYASQSSRYRASALGEIREGNWQWAEELLWGSLIGAVKAVALSRGVELRDDEDARRYLAILAGEKRNRRIGDAFDQLSSYSDILYRIQDSTLGPDRLYNLVERVSYVVESLWEMLPPDERTEQF